MDGCLDIHNAKRTVPIKLTFGMNIAYTLTSRPNHVHIQP